MVFEDVMMLVATCKFHLIQSMYTKHLDESFYIVKPLAVI